MYHFMKSRHLLGQYLNHEGLINEGVEVGVYRGDFSKEILQSWRGKILYCVDSWKHYGAKLDRSDVSDYEHLVNIEKTKESLKGFRHRSQIWKVESVVAATYFKDKSLDFVYLDARHDYRSVWADLGAWYPKIKAGGVLAGHDYKNSCVRKNLVEVKRAVDRFFWTKEKIQVTSEDNIPSWWIIKQ